MGVSRALCRGVGTTGWALPSPPPGRARLPPQTQLGSDIVILLFFLFFAGSGVAHNAYTSSGTMKQREGKFFPPAADCSSCPFRISRGPSTVLFSEQRLHHYEGHGGTKPNTRFAVEEIRLIVVWPVISSGS